MSKKVGRRPYGRTPKQIEAVKYMRRHRNLHHGSRKSYCEIANIINSHNVRYPAGKKHYPPPAGQQWYPTTIKNILERLEDQELRERKKKVRQYLDIPQGVVLLEYIERESKEGSWRARRRAAVVATLLFSGLRVSELCNLQYRDLPIIHGKDMIAVRKRKPDQEYGEVRISGYLTDLLNGFIGRPKSSLKPTAWVFPNENKKKQKRRQVWDSIKRIGRTLNLDFLHPHALRHSYASILLFDSRDPHFVKRQLGHGSLVTTDIYVNVIFMHLEDDTPPEIYRLLEAVNPLRKVKPTQNTCTV